MIKAKTAWTAAALMMCAGLIGCQGENTFRRESNPVKKYDHVLQGARGYDPNRQAAEQAEQDALAHKEHKPCAVPFNLTIDGEDSKSVSFTEEKEKSIVLNVASSVDEGMPWDVKLINSPCAKCFVQVSKDETKAVYKFTWTAPKGSTNAVDSNILTLRYQWQPEARCASLPITQSVSLMVKATGSSPSAPVIKISGLRQDTIKYGDKALVFQIQVIDSGTKLNVGKVNLKADDGVMNAFKAVDCASTGQAIKTDDGKAGVSFTCALDSKLIPTNDEMTKYSGSGKTIEASFSVKAVTKLRVFHLRQLHACISFSKKSKEPLNEALKPHPY